MLAIDLSARKKFIQIFQVSKIALVFYLFIASSAAIAQEAKSEPQEGLCTDTTPAPKKPLRIERPRDTSDQNHDREVKTTEGAISQQNSEQAFRTIIPGIASRWWRKFKEPSFCPYIICGGSCANVMGVPIVGRFSENELSSPETPCSLASVEAAGGCCIQERNESCSMSEPHGAASCCKNDTHK